MDILILIGSFFFLCLLGLPVAYALGLSAILAALWIDIPLEAVMLKTSDGMDDFALLAIPFFILAGGIMAGAEWRRGSSTWPRSSSAGWQPGPGQHPGVGLLRLHLRLLRGGHGLDRLRDDPAR